MAQVIDLDGERPGRRRGSSADAVAAGALRASGERARRRRRTTPLLADLEQQPPADLEQQPPADASEADAVVDVRADAPAEIDLREPAATPRRPARAPRGAQASGDGRGTDGAAGEAGGGNDRRPARRAVRTSSAAANGTSSGARRRPPAGRRPSEDAAAVDATASDATASGGAASGGAASGGAASGGAASGGAASGGAASGGTSSADLSSADLSSAGTQDGSGQDTPSATVRPARRPGSSGARRVPRVRQTVRETSNGERLVAVADLAEQAGEAIADALDGSRRAGDVEEKIASVLAFLRRRLTGEYEVDEFGFDRELTETVLLAVVRPLYKRWFRVEVRGIENIPDTGGALVVANHSGAVALDSLMTQVAVHDTHPNKRFLRMLGADLVFSTPFIGEIARKGGATLAANADAERLLSAGEVVGVWPEGFKGIGKPFSERYKLQRFGRGGFVSAALRTRTPIVPCAIVGAEETYPIIGNLPTLARLLGLPYFPVTPTFPLLGPLGAIPLPSKWLIEFGAPVPTDELGIGAAEDPMLVFDLTDQVRQTIQQTLYSLLVQRRSVFF